MATGFITALPGLRRIFGRMGSGVIAPPVNLTPPIVTGGLIQGQTLTSTNGTWTGSPTSYSYQWQSNGVNVGTNQPTYVTQPSDVGNTITDTVTATNAGGSASQVSNTVGPIQPIPPIEGRIFDAVGRTSGTLNTTGRGSGQFAVPGRGGDTFNVPGDDGKEPF